MKTIEIVPPMTSGRLYIDVILKSKGMKATNRLHSHSFSTNILTMNGTALLEAIDVTNDVDFMIQAFQVRHEKQSTQLHRETNRLVHNYLCAVSTFIEHTRNFMKRHYANTPFHVAYQKETKTRFADSAHARFVRDLRNYITHRGLPDSVMNLHFVNDTESTETSDGKGSASSEIHYRTEHFLSWDRWSRQARSFLKSCDETLSIREIFKPHFEAMQSFLEWFDNEFHEHHEADFRELQELREEMERLEIAEGKTTPPDTLENIETE